MRPTACGGAERDMSVFDPGPGPGDVERRREQLLARFVARDVLTADERSELLLALESDEAFLRRLIDDLQMDGALRAAGDIERGQEGVIAAVKALVTAAGHTEEVVAAVRRRLEARAGAMATLGAPVRQGTVVPLRASRARRVFAGIAIIAAGAAAVALLRPRSDRAERGGSPVAQQAPQPPARVPNGPGARVPALAPNQPAAEAPRPHGAVARLEAVDGPAYRHGTDGVRRAAPQLDLGLGDWISTSGTGARARLTSVAGGQVDLGGDAVAALSADAPEAAQAFSIQLFIAHGRAEASLPTPTGTGPVLVLASPHATVTGAGKLHLEVGSAFTRVEVREGHARVSALGVQRGTDLEAGQMALVSGDDLQPPRAQAAPREALLLFGPDDTKEGPPPAEGLRGSEERLKARLERLGFEVSVADAATVQPERARGVALVVFSSSVSSQLLPAWWAELPVPLMVLESTGYEQLGFTGSRWRRDVGPTPTISDVVIQNGAHPLAGGLDGTVKAFTVPQKLRWAAPAPGAVSIATYAGAPEQATLMFGYDRGAVTASGVVAPARRVGIFLGNGRVIRALTEPGWKLFDAAVLWLLGTQ
jgi:hypothetical protein